jgi:SH3-like domain-containing protein
MATLDRKGEPLLQPAVARFLAARALVLLAAAPLCAQEAPTSGGPQASGLPLPRFVSLRADEVNMRTGPGVRYPVDWVYKRKNMPVEVIAEFGTWRKVRDIQGTQGWIHQSMLSNNRWITITGQTRTLRRKPDAQAPAVARIEPGASALVLECPEEGGWCRVQASGHEGWLRRVEFWGLYPREQVK